MKRKATFKRLQALETKMNRLYYRSRNPEYWMETKTGSRLVEQWDAMITELRGWGEISTYEDRGKTLPSWLEYCGSSINPNYNLGDILA